LAGKSTDTVGRDEYLTVTVTMLTMLQMSHNVELLRNVEAAEEE
jgi:hypothetical protein